MATVRFIQRFVARLLGRKAKKKGNDASIYPMF